jgi:hypothetical protein
MIFISVFETQWRKRRYIKRDVNHFSYSGQWRRNNVRVSVANDMVRDENHDMMTSRRRMSVETITMFSNEVFRGAYEGKMSLSLQAAFGVYCP